MKTNDPANVPQEMGAPILAESGLVQRVRAVIARVFPGTRPYLLVGYSGGRDSLALLVVLRELKRLGVCRITAVHVNHRMQPDSDADADRAKAYAEKLDVSCMVMRALEHPGSLFPGHSLEDAARKVRYGCFAQATDALEADAVVVGHHQQDQAETVLLHLLRGSGLSGLRGMAVDSRIPAFGPEGETGMVRTIRPLLHEHPSMLEEVSRQSGIPLIEDASNDDPAFRRNRIRHELLPLVEDIAPGAASRLVSLADLVSEDDDALKQMTDDVLGVTRGDDALVWSRLADLPLGLQRRVVREWLREHATADVSRNRVDAVVALGGSGVGGKRVELGVGWDVTFWRGRLCVSRADGELKQP